MRVDCESCGKALQVPDDKVPDRAFSLTCPGCQNRIHVDPSASAGATQAPAAPAPAPAPQESSPSAAAAPAASASDDPFGGPAQDSTSEHDVRHQGEMSPLRARELELMERMAPNAFVIDLGVAADPQVAQQLKLFGMKEIRHFQSLQEACERAEESEAGLLVIRMDKAPAPPCEPLDALYRMPHVLRRRLFVALMAENVRTLDGQVAFYLMVNCLINAEDAPRLGVPLRRAVLFHLRHYRHWWDTQEGH